MQSAPIPKVKKPEKAYPGEGTGVSRHILLQFA
jgi:hypothetical protein